MGVPVSWWYGLSTSTFPLCICFLEQKGTLCVGWLTAVPPLSVLSCVWSEHQTILVVTVNINLPAFQRQAQRTKRAMMWIKVSVGIKMWCVAVVNSISLSCLFAAKYPALIFLSCSFCWSKLWWFYCQTQDHTAQSLHLSVFYAKVLQLVKTTWHACC